MKSYLYLLVLLFTFHVNAQTANDFLISAKGKIDGKSYQEALLILNQGISTFPKDHDLIAYKSRVMAWKGDYLSADSLVDQLLIYYPQDLEAFLIKSSIYLWSKDYSKLLDLTLKASSLHPRELTFSYYAALAYWKQDRSKESLKKIDWLLSKNPNYQDAIKLKSQVKQHYHNYVLGSFSYSKFNKVFDPWTEGIVGFGSHKKLKWNTTITYAQRFNKTGFNINAEAYPKLGKNNYLLVEGSASDQSIFPKYTIGSEFFQNVKNLEFSVGGRFMSFQDRNVKLYKMGVGIYLKNNFFQYRSYASEFSGNLSFSHLIKARKYFKTNFQYLELELTTGNNSVEFRALSDTQILNTKGIGLRMNQILFKNLHYNLQLRYQEEEYIEGLSRNRMEVSFGLKSILD